MQITSVRQTEAAGVETASRNRSVPLTGTGPSGVGATATAASTAGIDMEIGTFIAYIRRRAADDATATAASTAETLATPPSPGVNVDATEGATAHAASAAAVSFESSDIGVFSPPAADDATMPTASAAATLADSPFLDVAVGTADGATATCTTTDVPPTDDTADDAAADTHASAVDADAQVGCAPVATPLVAAARKRKGRGKHNRAAQDERKRQHRAALLLATQGNNTEAGT